MGFSVKRINKYVRWIKKHRADYRENCKVSSEYAKLCSDVDWALLLKKPENQLDAVSMRKHERVLHGTES